MKRLLIIVALTLCVCCNAQRQSWSNPIQKGSRNTSDIEMVKLDGIELNKDINLYLDKAGRSLQWSSTFDCLAGCCMLMSVLSYSELMTEDKDIARTIGAISAAMAVASGVTAIYFKYRTGMELRLAAGSISVIF